MARSGSLRRFVVPLLLGASLFGACSDSKSPSATSSPAPGDTSSGDQTGDGVLDACTLLTPDEINAQFQYQVGEGVASSPGGPICNWSTVDFHQEFSGVQLTVSALDQEYFDFVKDNVANRIDVTGHGDAAFWEAPQNPYVLDVAAGGVHFILYVVAGGDQFTPEATQQLIINLADNVIARL